MMKRFIILMEAVPQNDGASAGKVFLNLGCGFKKYQGYINVDTAPQCTPDVVWNLEDTPWPWEDSSVDGIKLEHVLEHVGKTTDSYLRIWKELWRVSKPGATIDITVPHWNDENFHHDPTHVRAITPVGVAMFDQARNMHITEEGGQETPLGLFNGIDIDLQAGDFSYVYTPTILEEMRAGRLSEQDVAHLRSHQNNICTEIHIRPRVVKPVRGDVWLKAHGYITSKI